jgi:hypothetical protein
MMNDEERLKILTKVYDNQQSLISNADKKANISLGVQLFLMTTVFGASVIVNAPGMAQSLSCLVGALYYLLFASFLMSSIIGLTLCIFVFRPRPPQEKSEQQRQGITFFGHIRQFKNSKEYLDAINESDKGDLVKEFAFQNYSLALILHHKMKYVGASTIILFINILLGVSLFILSMATR